MAFVYSIWEKEEQGFTWLVYVGFSEAQYLDSRMRGHRLDTTGQAIIRYVEIEQEIDAFLLEAYLISTEVPFLNRKGNWKQIPTLFKPTYDSINWQVWQRGIFEGGRYTSCITPEMKLTLESL